VSTANGAGRFAVSANSSEPFEARRFAQDQAECRSVVVFGQGGLEICRSEMIWASLVAAPFHEKTIAQAPPTATPQPTSLMGEQFALWGLYERRQHK